MLETLLALTAAHLLADFVFQPDGWVARKRDWRMTARHTAVVAALSAFMLGTRTMTGIAPIAIVAITHFAADLTKARSRHGTTLAAFAVDQLFHLAVLCALSVAWPDMARQGWWGLPPGDVQARWYAGLVAVCGFVVAAPMAGIIISKLTQNLAPTPQREGVVAGMAKGGRYIGWLERSLILIFILAKQPEAVGLLLAAKSILRFGDVRNNAERHQAEYIIIGTFLSFGFAIVIGLATKVLVDYWLP